MIYYIIQQMIGIVFYHGNCIFSLLLYIYDHCRGETKNFVFSSGSVYTAVIEALQPSSAGTVVMRPPIMAEYVYIYIRTNTYWLPPYTDHKNTCITIQGVPMDSVFDGILHPKYLSWNSSC